LRSGESWTLMGTDNRFEGVVSMELTEGRVEGGLCWRRLWS